MDANTLEDRLGRWFKPYAALWITMLVGGALVITMALLGAEVYDNVVDEEGLASLDLPALEFAQDLADTRSWMPGSRPSPTSAAASACPSWPAS